MMYLFLAIGVIVILVLVFFVTYFLNKKTPLPKGCEDLRIGKEGCSSCKNFDCSLRRKLDLNDNESRDE